MFFVDRKPVSEVGCRGLEDSRRLAILYDSENNRESSSENTSFRRSFREPGRNSEVACRVGKEFQALARRL